MNEEEKKAIRELEGCRDFWKEQLNKPTISEEDTKIANKEIEHDTILLNLIEKQQKELEKKDKTIDLMADNIADSSNVYENLINSEFQHTKEEVIEYFTKKAEENNG